MTRVSPASTVVVVISIRCRGYDSFKVSRNGGERFRGKMIVHRLGEAYVRFGLCKADQGEMTERGHCPALDEPYTLRALRPARIAFPRELRSPAKPPRRRGKPLLQGAPQARLGADTADQDDLAAPP